MKYLFLKKVPILIVVFSSLSALTVYVHGVGSYTLQQFVNLFAGGRSTSKTITFFLYLGFLYTFFLIQKNKKIHILHNPKTKKALLFLIVTLGVLGVLYLGIFSKKFNLPIGECVTIFNNQEISSTCISHNHITKGAIASIISLFGIHSLESVDAGHAFLGLLPAGLFYIYLLVLLITVGSALLVYTQEEYSVKKKFFFIPLYAITTFGLIEHIFDGGIFDPRTIVLFGLFVGLLYGIKKKQTVFIFGSFLVGYIVFLIHVSIGTIMALEAKNRMLFSLLAYCGLILLPMSYMFGHIEKKYKIITVVSALTLLVPFFLKTNDVLYYRNTTIEHTTSYIASYQSHPEFEKIDTVGKLGIYEVKDSPHKNIGELADAYHLLDNIRPISVFWKTCVPSQHSLSNTYTLKTTKPLQNLEFKSSGGKITTSLTLIHEEKKFFVYKGTTSVNGCIPRILNVIQESIQVLGAQTFFISDIQTQDEF